MKSTRNVLENAVLGLAAMFGCYWLWAVLLAPRLQWPVMTEKLIGLACLYGICFGLFLLIGKPGEGEPQRQKKLLPLKTGAFCVLLQFTAIMLMSLVNNLLNAVGLIKQPAALESTTPYMLFMLLVFNPVMEELVFRKLLGRLLLPLGNGVYLLVSAFCFGVVHAVSLGIPQVLYTFLLGLIWGWVYLKTGRFRLVVLLHSLSNLFGSVILQALMGISEMAAGLYGMLMMVLGAIGLSLLIANRKKIIAREKDNLFGAGEWRMLLTAPGIWVYLLLTVCMMVLKAW